MTACFAVVSGRSNGGVKCKNLEKIAFRKRQKRYEIWFVKKPFPAQEARVAQPVNVLCLSPLKPFLVCGISCETVPAVDLAGYSGFPPSLKSTQIRTIEGHKFISYLVPS